MKTDQPVAGFTRKELEYIRMKTDQDFNDIKSDWLEQLRWTMPSRSKWLENKCRDRKNNYIVVDGTHVLAQRSFVAGFLEGNTSASRMWYNYQHPDADLNRRADVRSWLDIVTRRAMSYLAQSNFYHAAGQFYYDFGSVNTGCHVIQRVPRGLFWHTLVPGSYRVVNNALQEATTLVREFTLDSKALIDNYATYDNSGNIDWSKFSKMAKKLYEDCDYTEQLLICQIIVQNKNYDAGKAIGGSNRQWVSITYEMGLAGTSVDAVGYGGGYNDGRDEDDECKYLAVDYSKRKPFIVGKSQSSNSNAYGEKGPTTDAIGLIRSLNKKAISKDVAIEKMLDPTVFGPASLRKTYATTQARKFIGLDPTAMAQGGMRTVFDINPAIQPLVGDVLDMRNQVEKFYYADFLMYLSMNPKTRTATETQAVINEQKTVIGPNLQSLNWSYNMPIAEYMLDFVIHEDPYLPPMPEALSGQSINTEFVSPFAQVQKAADLPTIEQYVDRWTALAQINPQAWANINLDKLAEIYEDRFYLPSGLNNPKGKVEALRRQAEMAAQRQQMVESLPNVTDAAKNINDLQGQKDEAEADY
jgi:hypothetical protein